MAEKLSVALLGAGAMGGALLKGWLEAGEISAAQSAVFDPAASDAIMTLCKTSGVAVNPPVGEGSFDAVVIALKPQVADAAVSSYSVLANDALIISVMAGKTVASIAAALGGATKIARAMPNLPAAIGCGVSGLFAAPAITVDERTQIETLMAAAGETVWVESEEQIDVVTAISGSGPAYFFLLTEALAEAGATLGLSEEAAAKLARATFSGAGALIDVDPRSPADMRRAVTSPGGTTEAALTLLDGDEKALRKLIKEAAAAAAKRAGELTG